MNKNVIITCAITGAGETTDKSEHVPVLLNKSQILHSRLRKQVPLLSTATLGTQKLEKVQEIPIITKK